MRSLKLLAVLPFLLLLAGCGGGGSDSSDRSKEPPQYTITDLSDKFASVRSINNRGQILGQDYRAGDGSIQAALLSPDGGITRIAGPLGREMTMPVGVNDNGVVVASYTTDDFHTRSFLWSQGNITELGNLGGQDCVALGLNNENQIIGQAAVDDNPYGSIQHAFLWKDGQLKDLGTAGGKYSVATAINDAGEIIGTAQSLEADENGFPIMQGVLWKGTKRQSLREQKDSLTTYPSDVNNRGQVVGSLSNYAFLWENGEIKNLSELGGIPDFVSPIAINNHGDVIGGPGGIAADVAHSFVPPALRAFLYREGKTYDLQTRIPSDSGWTIQGATDINDQGQIVGYGVYHGQNRPFLLTPKP